MDALEFVLRILLKTPEGRFDTNGTGILVAPDRVLTCQHVTAEIPADSDWYPKSRLESDDYQPEQLAICQACCIKNWC